MPADAAPATAEEAAEFRQTPHGAILASWWGRDTDRPSDLLRDRIDRFCNKLTDEGFAEWQDLLWNRLEHEAAAKSCMRP